MKEYISSIPKSKHTDSPIIKLNSIGDEEPPLSRPRSIFSFFDINFSGFFTTENQFSENNPYFPLLRLPFPEFNLSKCDLSGSHRAFLSFLKSQAQNRRLKMLNFSRARGISWDEKAEMGAEYEQDGTIDALGKVSPSLEYPNLSYTRFPASAIKALAHFSHLIYLDLSANTIGDQGAEGLASCCWPALKSLSLSGARIGDKGATAFAQAPIEAFPALELLDLSNNGIKDNGVIALSKTVVGAFPALEFLDLGGNFISHKYKGLKSLLSAIGTTSLFSLKKLTLWNQRMFITAWHLLSVNTLIERGVETLDGKPLILEKRSFQRSNPFAARLPPPSVIGEWEEKKVYSHKEIPTGLGTLVERTVKTFNGEEVAFERKVKELKSREVTERNNRRRAILIETVTTASGEKKQIDLLIERNLIFEKMNDGDIVRFMYPNLQHLEALRLSPASYLEEFQLSRGMRWEEVK